MTTPNDPATGLPLTPGHVDFLTRQAITVETLRSAGVYSITDAADLPEAHAPWGDQAVPSIAFPWRTPAGQEFIQLRPDSPIPIDGEKSPRKYLWPKGQSSAITVVREDGTDRVLFVEGTKQSLAAASYVDSGSVYGIAGCRSWSTDGVPLADLEVVEDKDVYLIFDADVTSNPDVYDAAVKFTLALKQEGARSVSYAILAAGGKAGLDDVLGSKAEGKRAKFLARVIEQAVRKLPARPKAKGTGPKALPGSDDRPMIVVNEDRLAVIDGITATLARRWSGTELFNFGEVLAWRRGHEMVPVERDRFNDLVAQAAITGTMDSKGNFVAAWPDAGSMTATLSRAERFPRLRHITRTPFVRPDGSVCQSAGYDEATQTYLVLGPELEGIQVPDDPTPDEIMSAVKLLRVEWLGDLMAAMESPADEANLLATMLTPFVRGMVPLSPLAVVNGLQMGVGKNLTADLISILTTGVPAQPLPYSREDDENRKVITAAFRSGRTLFVFDEAHVIEGAALARAITSMTYTDRVLGVSTNAEFPNAVTWMALGNNVAINGDMSRRAYIIRMAPKVANPQDRSADEFRHPDIKGWTVEHRAELVQAALTLVRAWFAAGQPQNAAGRRMGSFEQWGGMLGGILDVAGVPDFLGNLLEWRSETDYERAYWTQHLVWLFSIFGDAEFTVAEVVKAMGKGAPGTVEHPPKLSDHSAPDYRRQLGQAYGRQRDKVSDGYQLVRVSQSASHGNRWAVRVLPGTDTTPDLGFSPDGPDHDTGSPSDDADTPRDDTTPGLGERENGGDGGGSGGSPHLHVMEKTPSGGDPRVHVISGAGQVPTPPTPQIPHEDHAMPASAQVDPSVITDRYVWSLPRPPSAWSDARGESPGQVLCGLVSGVQDTPECPDCDGPKELVPPGNFWFACPRCTPGTFQRV
jgi:hypothetical protein